MITGEPAEGTHSSSAVSIAARRTAPCKFARRTTARPSYVHAIAVPPRLANRGSSPGTGDDEQSVVISTPSR